MRRPRHFPDLLLLALGSLALAGPIHAQTILGRLIDGESMQPIPFGVVRLLSPDSVVLTFTASGPGGAFTLVAPDSGQYLILAEAYSYLKILDGPVSVPLSGTAGVEFFIPPDPELLDPLMVVATRTERRLRMAGFYRRMDRGMGQFMTREAIDETRAHDLSGVLATVPGMVLRPARDGRLVPLFLRGQVPTSLGRGMRCYPTYYLDGVRVMEAGTEIDYLIHPSSIEAIEAYASRGETPARFRESWNPCGTILIWTRK